MLRVRRHTWRESSKGKSSGVIGCKIHYTEAGVQRFYERTGRLPEQPHYSALGWLPDPEGGMVHAVETDDGRYYIVNEKTGKYNRVPKTRFLKEVTC